jgi:hypothetical protein
MNVVWAIFLVELNSQLQKLRKVWNPPSDVWISVPLLDSEYRLKVSLCLALHIKKRSCTWRTSSICLEYQETYLKVARNCTWCMMNTEIIKVVWLHVICCNSKLKHVKSQLSDLAPWMAEWSHESYCLPGESGITSWKTKPGTWHQRYRYLPSQVLQSYNLAAFHT